MIAINKPVKKIFPDTNVLYETVANLIIDTANKSIASGKKFSIALSGGHTPEQLYKIMSLKPFIDKMPWKKTFVFWGDERCVPLEDNRNNAHRALVTLLNQVPLPHENIFRIPVNLLPAEAAQKYEQELRKFFGKERIHFDLVLLGLGENGHTASLFPESEILTDTHEGIREFYLEEEKIHRITMTAPLINNANHILFIVTGEKKAEVLNEVINGKYQPEKLPAQLIKPVNGTLTWFMDSNAAKKLNGN